MNASDIDKIVEEVRTLPLDVLKQLFDTHPKFTTLPENVQTRVQQEVKRLWKATDLNLDLRYKVEGLEVKSFEHLGVTHYLDNSSKAIFLDEVRAYQNAYTMGVYQSVKRYFDLNRNQLLVKQELLQNDLHVVRFGNLAERSEERMNLAISASAFILPDIEMSADYKPDEASLGPPIPIVTSNISHTGLKIRSKTVLEKGALLCIRFDDLEKELIFKQKLVTYRILHCRFNPQYKMFDGMLKVEDIDANQEFKNYTRNLIYSHKHKYKVELDYIYNACLSKGLEQYYIDKTLALNVFVDSQCRVKNVFSNRQSEGILRTFDLNGKSYLQDLFAKDGVLEHLLHNKKCFYFVTRVKTNKSGNMAFLSTIVDGSDASLSLLEKFNQGKASQLFKLSLQSVDESSASQRSTIPAEAQDNYGSGRVHRFSSQALEQVRQCHYGINISPLLDTLAAKITWSPSPYKATKSHILSQGDYQSQPFSTILAEHEDNRCEDRFVFSSPVTLTYKGQKITGHINNISVLGLQVILSQAIPVQKRDIVSISFDEFVERTTLYSLKRCEYKVVFCNGKTLGLSSASIHDHDGRKFLQRFIEAKLDTLKQLGRESEVYGLNRLLRNLSAAHSPSFQFFVYYYRHKLAISAVAVPGYAHQQIADKNKLSQFNNNVKSWLYEQQIIDVIQDEFKNHDESQGFVSALVVTSFKHSKDKLELAKAWVLNKDSLSTSTLLNTMKVANIKKREMRVYELKIGKTEKEFKRYYLDELSYIKKYAPHKFQQLREEITKVKGMMEVTDLTELMLYLRPKE